MPNEHAIAQSYFRADPQALAARRKEQLRRDQLFQQGQDEALQAEKELERQREQHRRLQEDEQKRLDALAKDAAQLATKKRLAETELYYRRAGRPTFTDALGEIRPVDDDATWQAKQEGEKLKQQQDAQARADTAFRQSEAIRIAQQQKQVASGLTTYKASTALASQAASIKAGQIAADTQRLKHLQNTATTPEQLAEADAISARIAAAQAEKAQLDDNERALRLAQTNEELLREPELQALDQQRTTLPLQHAPDFSPPATQPRTAAAPVAPGSPVPTNLPAQPGTLTPASEDPNKSAAVLRGLITRLREKGDHRRADHLESRLTNPAGWHAAQRAFRATATPQQLATAVEEQAPALAQTAQDIETAYTSLATSRQQILARLDTARERNAALLAQPYTDADTVVLTNVNTGETTRWHKAAASAYTAAGQALQQWTQENQPQIDLLDIERQNLLIEGENLRKHQNQLDYLAREDQRNAEAKQTSALDSLRKLPGMAEFADESLALTTRAKERLAELETKYPDPTIRSVAQKAVQDDIAAQSTRLQERMEARQAAQRQLYTDFAQGQRVTDWRTENSGLAVTLAQKAKALGLSEQEARDAMEAQAAADWSHPRALDQNADPIWEDARQLPDGSLTVNPTHWLDPEAYTQAVQASAATPEAKQHALDSRRELAAPLAAQALLELQKNDTIGRYIEKETTGTPLERMEQLQQQMKAGGAIAASLQRFQGGASGIAKSAFGLLAAGTDSDWARENAQTFSDRAAGYEALAEMAGKGTGALGRFTSKVIGATPSVLASLAPGGAISAGANALRLGYQAANRLALAGAALASGAQSAGSTYLDAFNAARAKGLSESEAHASALTPTLLSGGVTTLLTGLSGLRGAESLIARGTQDLFKKTLLERAKAIGIGFVDESLEEGFDQLFQGIIAKATYAPDKPLSAIVEESLEAALIGGVLGGGITTAQEGAQAFSERRGGPRDSQLAPHQLPETLAAAREAIRSTPTLDADQRHRAMAALKIAQGRLDIVTDQEAKALGWFRQDGKWRPRKDYTGPAVLDFYNGDPTKPVLLQGYIDTLDQQLPAVHAAIGMDEADLLETYARPAAPSPASTTAQPREAQSTAQPPQPPANAAPGSPSPTLESPAQGTATATPAPVSATAPGGSTAGPFSQPPPTTANEPQAPSTTANERSSQIANHLALAGMDPAAAQQIGDYTVRTQGVVGKTYTEQITGPVFANLLDSLGVKGDRRTGANTAPLTAPTDLAQRLASLERSTDTPAPASPSTTAQPREAQSTAQPPQTSPSAGTASPPGIAAGAPILQEKAATALIQRIKAKEITDQDLVLEVSRQIPNASTQALVDILIHQLDIYPQRAKLAVLAAKDSLQSDRIPSAQRSAGTPARPVSPAPSTTANASAASQPLPTTANAAVAALPPARRKRARTTLKALDKALQKWGKAFDRVSYTNDPDSPALAAVSENGKMTLQVNLPALLYQFDYLARSEDAVLATLSEEFIHAVALRLAATDPRFQHEALVNLWNRLDPQGRDLIWTTYHNAEIQAGRKPRAVPDTLTDAEKFHMAHEMLRLLVQQKAFRAQFTEAVGPRRDILRWIKRLLSTLSQRLTKWMRKAPPELQGEIEYYRARIIASLAHFEGAYVAETILQAEEKTSSTTANGSEAALQQLQTIANSRPLSPAEASAYAILEAEAAQALLDQTQAMARAEAERLLPGVSDDIQRRLLARQLQRQAWEAQIASLQARMQRNLEQAPPSPPTTANASAASQPPQTTANLLPSPAQVSALNIIDALQQREFAAQQNTSPEAARAIRKRLISQMWEAMVLDISARVERRMAYKAGRLTAGELYQLDDVLRVARGDFQLGTAFSRRNIGSTTDGVPVRPFGYANEATLGRLGLAITENGILYSTDPDSPAYVERNQILIRQAYLDDLAARLPITRQQIAMDEAQARAHFGLPANPTPTTGRNLHEQLPERTADTPVRSGSPSPSTTAQQPAGLNHRQPSPTSPSGSQGLPDPTNYDDRRTTGADLISFLQREGFSLGWPKENAGGEWDWLRNLERQAAQMKEHNMTLKAAASRGEVDHPRALLLWLENQGILDRSSPDSRIDEVASAAEAAGFDLSSGIGEAVLDAVDARVKAKTQAATQSDPLAEAEAQALRFLRDTADGPIEIQPGDLIAQWEEGSAYVFLKGPDGEPHKVSVTDAQWTPMDAETSEMDDYQEDSPWFRGREEGQPERLMVTLQDGTTYGRQTVPAESKLRVDSPGNTEVAKLNEGELSALPDSPEGSVGTPARPGSPVPQTTANARAASQQPQTTANASAASLQDDYLSSVDYGRALEDSIPPDVDLAATADDYLDSLEDPDAPPAQRLFASPRLTRSIHPLALPRSHDTLSADERLRSPAHILASLSADTGPDARADRRQRREPGPSIGGHPRDHALILDWARNHGRVFAVEDLQVGRISDPSQVRAGGEHLVMPATEGRLYKFTKPAQYGAQALDAPAYLERWALANRLFDDDVRFEGYTQFPGEQDPRAVISQPFRTAANPRQPDASLPEIKDWLNQRGFYDFEGYFVHPVLGVQIWDIQTPGNVIRTPNGLAAVDLQIEPAPADRLKRLREKVQQGPRTPLFAAPRVSERSAGTPARPGSPPSPTTANGSAATLQPPQTTANRIQAAARLTNVAPTEAQKEAENYQTGKVTVQGLRLSIENPHNSTRSGTDANGKPWSITMPHHYGRILGTTGADKDHVDFFLGPNPESPTAFIVNQRKPGNGHFDEHKVMLGFSTPGQAARGYLDSYSKGWRGYGSMVAMTLPELKQWLAEGDMSKPATKPEGPAGTPARSPSPTHTFPDGYTLTSPGLQTILPAGIRAYHGTPHKVDKFLTSRIGTGEGSQAYGWGLYFAENQAVAKDYADRLSGPSYLNSHSYVLGRAALKQARDEGLTDAAMFRRANQLLSDQGNAVDPAYPAKRMNFYTAANNLKEIDASGGNLYTVELLPDEADFLDWDKPLVDQSEKVKAFAAKHGIAPETGGNLYRQLQEALIRQGKAEPAAVKTQKLSKALAKAGIPGIRYLDGNSRSDGTGTYNYVLFDDKLVRILEENGIPVPPQTTANGSAATLQPPPTTANLPPLPASPRQALGPVSRASFNHLDRRLHSALSTVAAKVTSTDPVVAGIQAMKAWYGADRVDANAVRAIKEFVQGQVIPETVLPREVLSAMRMMGIKIAQGQQQALDVGRALSGNPKFSDLAYPKEFVENPEWRAKLFDAMEGRGAMEDLPEALQKVGLRLRQMLIEPGREAVRQGRMSPDTFEGLRTTYMPRFTQDEAEASAGDWHKAFKLGIRDILAQRSTAYHITDTTRKDKHGLPVLIQHNGSRWRFPDQQARDAFYEDLIQQQMLNPGNLQDMNWLTPADRRTFRAITPEMLKAPALMTAEQRDLAARVEREMRTRYAKENPFTPPKLIKDPVYAIMRYLAQMSHDNATAEFFNLVASNPEWITTTETKGFKAIPDNPRFGVLAGKHVRKDIADQILELAESPNQFVQLYDTILRLWKTGKTVLNPATHARNIIGNIPFSQLAGNNILNPANAPHYLHALRVLKKGGAEYNQLYETGVLGADYATTELKNALQAIVPVLPTGPAQETSVLDSVIKLANSAAQWAKLKSVPSAAIGGSIGAAVGLLAAGPIGAAAGAAIGAYANPVYRAMLWAYRLEDDLFKAATFFKAKSMGMTPEAAAQHVRDWFPYYDKPSSTAIKWAGRSALPFVSFFRESARIGLKASKERPLSLVTTLIIPSLITSISAAMLGLGDDDLEEVKKDMRGKGAKLLGPTPLAGVPIFSMLLPIRTADGQLQQMDLSSTHPFADFIANRVENFGNQGFLQTWARSIFSNPLMSTGYTVATGKDSFGDRVVLPEDLNRWDYTKALMGHIWKTAVPPIAPGGTNWQTLENAGRRQANKTLALRNPTQAALRSLAGLDIRSADPNIYRMADDFRKARGLPVNETNQAFPTDASGRARKALFEELVQPQPDLTTITAQLQKLNDLGTPVRTLKDVLDILDKRRPDGIINPKDLRVPFRLSLPPEARRVLDTALQEFQKARLATPNAFQAARKRLQATTRSLETQD